jgi:hypothetical protein
MAGSLLNLQAFMVSCVHVALSLPRPKARHKAGYAGRRNRREASDPFELLRLTRILTRSHPMCLLALA